VWHKVRQTRTAESSAVLTCAERQSKVGIPTFQSPLNLHDLLRESFIVPFMVPSTSHSTIACAWLSLAIGSRTGPRRVRITHRATQLQQVEPQEDHIFFTSVSVTIQLRLGLCEIWLYFIAGHSRRADDIFTAQRPITRLLCCAQSGDKKCK